MNGLEATRVIRGLRHGDKAPVIIMVTAHSREFLEENHSEESALLDDFLVKPVTPSMLFDAVNNVTSGRHALAHVPSRTAVNSRRLTGLRLLVAEDNLLNQQVAEEILTYEGATVSLAASGRQAIEVILREEPFDAVLMDIQMPDMDGYEATLHIRNVLGLKELPIIAMTANAMQSDREQCLKVGMNGHVGKPFDVDALMDVLRRNCGMTMESETEGVVTDVGVNDDSLPKLDRPGFDCDMVLKRLGSNRALYARMARAFEKDQSLLMERLRQSLSLTDLHTIKGVSATMGATALSRAAADAEMALKSGTNPDGIILLSKEVERLFDEACLVFKDLAEELDPTPARAEAVAAMDSEAIVTALAQLEAMLMEGNMDAMQYYEETIAGLEGAGCVGAKNLLPLLDDAMQQLDFSAAAKLCREMRERVLC